MVPDDSMVAASFSSRITARELQIAHLFGANSELIRVEAPPADEEVIPGVRWGNINAPMSAAYWKSVACITSEPSAHSFRAGTTLRDETAVCLLSGYGIKAEVAYAAYDQIKAVGLIDSPTATVQDIETVLLEPLVVGDRRIRYRYPKAKAQYLHQALARFQTDEPPTNDLALRDWLLQIRGIGPKTASFIVRNWLVSDNVAILDIHVIRAGLHIGIFSPHDRIQTRYAQMEERFLRFAEGLGVRASILDSLIWNRMRDNAFASWYC